MKKVFAVLSALMIGIAFMGITYADQYGAWQTMHQWSGFDYRNRCENGNDRSGKTIMWIEVRNRYQKTAHLAVGIGAPGREGKTTDRLDIRSQGTGTTWYSVPTSACSGTWKIWTDRVRFGEDSGPYATPH